MFAANRLLYSSLTFRIEHGDCTVRRAVANVISSLELGGCGLQRAVKEIKMTASSGAVCMWGTSHGFERLLAISTDLRNLIVPSEDALGHLAALPTSLTHLTIGDLVSSSLPPIFQYLPHLEFLSISPQRVRPHRRPIWPSNGMRRLKEVHLALKCCVSLRDSPPEDDWIWSMLSWLSEGGAFKSLAISIVSISLHLFKVFLC